MGVLIDSEGRNVPLFVVDYVYVSIATEDFSPTEDASLSAEEIGLFEAKGFLVRPNADGDMYGITLYRYKNNKNSLTGLTPKRYLGAQNQWIECRFIKVYASNNGTYPSTATAINYGFTI
jgi:hypothetical protein